MICPSSALHPDPLGRHGWPSTTTRQEASGSSWRRRKVAYGCSPGPRRWRLRCATAGLTGKLPRLIPNGGGSGLPRGDRVANGRESTVPPSSDCTRKGVWHQPVSVRCELPSGTGAGRRRTHRPARWRCLRTSRQHSWITRALDALSRSWIARIATRFSIGCMMQKSQHPAASACRLHSHARSRQDTLPTEVTPGGRRWSKAGSEHRPRSEVARPSNVF
jgi:hypothetical protein